MNPRSIVIAAVLVLPRVVLASPDDDKALATELFAKGVKKLDEGKCDQPKITDQAACEEAREHFARAYEIYPAGLGALRNLAYTERGLGRTASAARHFRELQQKAPSDPNPKRHIWAEFAAKELEVLGPLIPHLTIVAPADHPEMTVSIDGKPLPAGAWGTAIEIDPGPHKVRAEAKDVAPFETDVTFAERDSKTVEVKFGARDALPPPPPPPQPKKAEAPSRVAPIVVASVGAATMVVGLALGYRAISAKKDACGDSNLCEPNGLEDARSAARWSNIVTGVGAAVMITGVTWFFLTPTKTEAPAAARLAPMFGPGFAGASLTGEFR